MIIILWPANDQIHEIMEVSQMFQLPIQISWKM